MMVTKYNNKSIALELFTNALYEGEGFYCAQVWGKSVDFSPQRINRLLGLLVPDVYDVERRRMLMSKTASAQFY